MILLFLLSLLLPLLSIFTVGTVLCYWLLLQYRAFARLYKCSSGHFRDDISKTILIYYNANNTLRSEVQYTRIVSESRSNSYCRYLSRDTWLGCRLSLSLCILLKYGACGIQETRSYRVRDICLRKLGFSTGKLRQFEVCRFSGKIFFCRMKM